MAQSTDGAGVQELARPVEHGGGAPAERPPEKVRWWRTPWGAGLLAVVVFNAVYALPRYLKLDPAQSRVPLDPAFRYHFAVIVAHVVTGNLALITLFLQVLPWIRKHYPAVHKVSGYVYVFGGALPSALLALILLPHSMAPVGKVGLATMAVLWIGTTLIGFRMQYLRRYRDHRRWMYYSFALALGTSWGRILAELMAHIPGFRIEIMAFLEIANWLGWVVNLLIVQWWLDRTARRRVW